MKKVLFVIGSFISVLGLAVAVFVLSFDINKYKPRIESAASEATGLEIKINGKLGLSLSPFGVSAGDLRMSAKGHEILSLGKLKLGMELVPLLKKQFNVTDCELVNPAVTIVKGADGKYNFEQGVKKPTGEKKGASFLLRSLRITGGRFSYLESKTNEKTEAKDISLNIGNFLIENTSGDIIKAVSFKGKFDLKELQAVNLKIENLKGSIHAEKGVYRLEPFSALIFGSQAGGDITIDESAPEAAYKINLKIPKLDIDKLEESAGKKKMIGGKADLEAALSMIEHSRRNLISSLTGSVTLRGDNLTTYTIDLDKLLSSYEKTQEFNVIDLGSFFVAGPLGAAAVKGYRYGDVYSQTKGGHGDITRLIALWKIKDGIAEASDCALATRHNRLALKGRLDLINRRYEKVTVALLDNVGCAKFKQGISGPFNNPQINTVGALAGPISGLFKKAAGLLHGGKCEIFYSGSIKQPGP